MGPDLNRDLTLEWLNDGMLERKETVPNRTGQFYWRLVVLSLRPMNVSPCATFAFF
jgi:hypothetical protein